jgi:pyrimidine operon attenuation protein/uracil phosphoribosyltransferase
LNLTLDRICHELIENHGDFSRTVLVGLQPRGVFFAERIHKVLHSFDVQVELGQLDITFYRDDFRRREEPIRANKTNMPFLVEKKRVVLIDDVLFTGRSVRAAMDALTAFGRPEEIELMVLIDRMYTRHLPVQPDYVGRQINSMISQKVSVEWEAVEKGTEDVVWLFNKEEA